MQVQLGKSDRARWNGSRHDHDLPNPASCHVQNVDRLKPLVILLILWSKVTAAIRATFVQPNARFLQHTNLGPVLQHHEEPPLPYLYPRVPSHGSSAFAIKWPENDIVLDVGKLCDGTEYKLDDISFASLAMEVNFGLLDVCPHHTFLLIPSHCEYIS